MGGSDEAFATTERLGINDSCITNRLVSRRTERVETLFHQIGRLGGRGLLAVLQPERNPCLRFYRNLLFPAVSGPTAGGVLP